MVDINKLRIGQKVRIRTWDELIKIKGYRINSNGDIDSAYATVLTCEEEALLKANNRLATIIQVDKSDLPLPLLLQIGDDYEEWFVLDVISNIHECLTLIRQELAKGE